MTDFHSEMASSATTPGYALILNTCPDQISARQIADALVERGLAACVNINPGAESVYRWKDKIEHAQEVLLIIKTRVDQYPALEEAICELHPYELPEIVMVSIDKGLQSYLHWIDRSLDVQS